MNTATIRRGNSRTARGGLSGGQVRRTVPRKGLVERLLEELPLTEDQIHKLMTLGLGLVFLSVIVAVAIFFGVPSMAWSKVSELAGRAGLTVAKVEVHGAVHLDEGQVYSMALDEVDHSMLALDLVGLRQRIMTMGWVRDARISRRLPDTLVVDIIERQPVAVWQHEGQLSLIDASGAVLAGVNPGSIPDLPLVVGPAANIRTQALGRLMDAAPALKPMLAGAIWVGNRRWDLKFQSGETLALPEGDAEAAAALVNFARMDGVDHLLGRGIVRFDMRDPARFVVRLPPGQAAQDLTSTSIATAQSEVPGTEMEAGPTAGAVASSGGE